MKKLFILIIIILVLAIGGWLFYREGILAVNKQDTSAKIFVVKPGEGLNSIINNLSAENLIRNRIIFYMIVKQQGIDRKIQAGDFRLSPSLNAYEIADALTHGTLDKWVTIREGLRKEEIAEIIGKEFDISETEFIQLAQEGYLFPDTYLFPQGATAATIIDTLKSTFEKKYDADLRARARKNGLTDQQVIILASMVEREGRTDADRQQIASILLKRFENDWPLDLDATVQYALGYDAQEKTWWRKGISIDDLKMKSMYNTYVNKGLPPGPICSPGLSSIEAVAKADSSTPYWFYLADSNGKTHYAKTTEEQDANARKYIK